MPKRFIDTEFFKHPFVRGLKAAYKSLYAFIFTDCDNSGIWIPEFEISSIYIDMKVDRKTAEQAYKGKFINLENGKWFFPDFIQHQYPNGLQEKNPAHKKIIKTLKELGFLNEKNELIESLKGQASTSEGTKDMVKDKDKVVDKEEVMVSSDGYENFIEQFNLITARYFRGSEAVHAKFRARIKDGFSMLDILKATQNCLNDPYHVQNPHHLTPEFILRDDKLQKYLNYSKPILNGTTKPDSQANRAAGLDALQQEARSILSGNKT